jgi:hypothetical protein
MKLFLIIFESFLIIEFTLGASLFFIARMNQANDISFLLAVCVTTILIMIVVINLIKRKII